MKFLFDKTTYPLLRAPPHQVVLGRDSVRVGPPGNLAAGQAAYPVHGYGAGGGGRTGWACTRAGIVLIHPFLSSSSPHQPVASHAPRVSFLPLSCEVKTERVRTTVRGDMERSTVMQLDTELRELQFGWVMLAPSGFLRFVERSLCLAIADRFGCCSVWLVLCATVCFLTPLA